MTLADTPTTWLEGHSLSTLEVLAIFVGIPLLVILTVFLLVYAPSWVHGPRYRPGQPWEGKSERFGASLAVEPALGQLATGDVDPGPELSGGVSAPVEDSDAVRPANPASGGASAHW